MSVSVNKPTNSQVDSWWKFALKFPQTASAFKNGIGANFESVANPNQPSNPYCLNWQLLVTEEMMQHHEN